MSSEKTVAQSLDQQIASSGNSIVELIQSHYGKQPIDNAVISNPTATLHARIPDNQLNMPSKACDLNIDFLDTTNDLNFSKQMNSMSFDPVIRRLVQEKNDILRAIEGWVASQANDGARQPILAGIITNWIKKAIGFMRCGTKIIRQVNTLINEMVAATLDLIGSIESLIQSDIDAANRFVDQFGKLDKELQKEGKKLEAIAIIYGAQDFLALYNEIGPLEKELIQLKNTLSKDHTSAILDSIINSFLALIDSFKKTVKRIQRNRSINSNLEISVVKMQDSLKNVNALDLSIPLNPGGVGSGALSNWTITNDSTLFPDHDSLTKGTMLIKWDKSPIQNFLNTNVAAWADIFNSNENGYLTVSSNDYGLFQVGLDYATQVICPGSSLSIRLVINGGDWIIQSTILGDKVKDADDPTNTKYATRNGVFVKVPEAPGLSTRMTVTFDEFIRSMNRPDYYQTGMSIVDPLNPPNNIIVPEKDENYVLESVPSGIDWSTLSSGRWGKICLTLKRFPNQSEINYYEDQYVKILQTLNISPSLYYNKYADPTNPAYDPTNPKSKDSSLIYTVYDNGTKQIKLSYRMPYDTQLKKALLSKKPFGGIQIYVKSLNFQISRQAVDIRNMPYFSYSDDSEKNSHVVRFGLKADWGFAPFSLIS